MAMLQTAEPELEADYGDRHPLRVLYGLNRASYLYRSGRAPEAMAVVASALPVMGFKCWSYRIEFLRDE